MKDDEYVEYATLCGEAGDSVTQRKVLFTLYRLDPTEAHGQLLKLYDAEDHGGGQRKGR